MATEFHIDNFFDLLINLKNMELSLFLSPRLWCLNGDEIFE